MLFLSAVASRAARLRPPPKPEDDDTKLPPPYLAGQMKAADALSSRPPPPKPRRTTTTRRTPASAECALARQAAGRSRGARRERGCRRLRRTSGGRGRRCRVHADGERGLAVCGGSCTRWRRSRPTTTSSSSSCLKRHLTLIDYRDALRWGARRRKWVLQHAILIHSPSLAPQTPRTTPRPRGWTAGRRGRGRSRRCRTRSSRAGRRARWRGS